MQTSTSRIRVSHAVTLPRPPELDELYRAGESRRADFVRALPEGVREVVRHQAQIGTDTATAIADAMHAEYKLITDSGLNIQIDDPDLPDGWQMFPDMRVSDYRRYAKLRVDALNHALRDIPEEQVRLHECWGWPRAPQERLAP